MLRDLFGAMQNLQRFVRDLIVSSAGACVPCLMCWGTTNASENNANRSRHIVKVVKLNVLVSKFINRVDRGYPSITISKWMEWYQIYICA